MYLFNVYIPSDATGIKVCHSITYKIHTLMQECPHSDFIVTGDFN